MGHALTGHFEKVITKLIRSGHFANRSEVVRAGLRKLEQEYLLEDYLHPAPLPPGTLARVYDRQSKQEQDEELQAVRASVQPHDEE